MTKKKEQQLMAITPYLLYEDVGGALKFLAKAFGFRKYGAQMLGPDGKINHAAMRLDDDLITSRKRFAVRNRNEKPGEESSGRAFLSATQSPHCQSPGFVDSTEPFDYLSHCHPSR